MSPSRHVPIHVEADDADDGPVRIRAGLVCLGLAAAILIAGWLWLGREGMLDPKSPDFFPLPHFFATAAILVGTFFLVRGVLFGGRYRKFGTSLLEAEPAELGGHLVARVSTAREVNAVGPFTVRLRCDRHFYSSSPGQSTQGRDATETLWEATQTLPQGSSTRTGLAITFDLPATGLPSGRRAKPATGVHPEPPENIEWIVSVHAPCQGLNYFVEFAVPVAPGAVIRALQRERNAGAAAARHAAPHSGEGVPVGAAQVALQAAALVFGGRVPDAEELAADAQARAKAEPAVPFAGEVQPVSAGTRLAMRALLVVGALLLAVGVWAVVTQLRYGAAADQVTGTVTAIENAHRIRLTLDDGGSIATAYSTSLHHWQPGQSIALACRHDAKTTPRPCRVDTGLDRWLDGLGTVLFGAVALALGLYLWRQAPRVR